MPPQDLKSNNLSLPFALVERVAHKRQYTLPGDVVDPPDVLKYGPWGIAETELPQRYTVVPQCVPFIFINTEPLGQARVHRLRDGWDLAFAALALYALVLLE
jgi:hypothetical protein